MTDHDPATTPATKPSAAWGRGPAVTPGSKGPAVYWVHSDGRRAVACGARLKVLGEPELFVDPGPSWRVEW